jgi:hypothetical protein
MPGCCEHFVLSVSIKCGKSSFVADELLVIAEGHQRGKGRFHYNFVDSYATFNARTLLTFIIFFSPCYCEVSVISAGTVARLQPGRKGQQSLIYGVKNV